MLRWLALGLLLCNGIYFVWQSLAEPAPPVAVGPAATEGQRLTLLREVGQAAPATAEPTAATAAAVAPSVPVCHMIGPLKELVSARQVKERLRALDISVHLYGIKVPGKPDYWVHLGPMRSRKEALDVLRELQGKKIDSFLITEGELANGISLGFFTREDLARAALKQRRDLGYDAKLQPVPRFSQELWAVFDDGEYGKFSDELWQQIQAGTQGLELRKNFCDAIASADKLE